MASRDEHHRDIVGTLLAQLIDQVALLRAELDATRERVRILEAERVRDGAAAP
jgi:hypothetical protein